VLAEATARGLLRTPYLPEPLASRPELARLLQNEEEVGFVQALIEARDLLMPELDAEVARHQAVLDRKWGRVKELRRKLEADPMLLLMEGQGQRLPGEAHEGPDRLMRALASRLGGVEAALRWVAGRWIGWGWFGVDGVVVVVVVVGGGWWWIGVCVCE
jgi:hypothetical protein